MALTACGSSNDSNDSGDDAEKSPSTASSEPAPSRSSADPETVAKQAVIGAYQLYLDEVTKAYSQASTDGTQIKKYATGSALATVQSEMKVLDKAGQVITGKPLSTPKVTSITLNRKVPKATITDCMDVSGWKLVDRGTKKEVALPKERLTRYVDIIRVEKWGQQWVVLSETPQERKC